MAELALGAISLGIQICQGISDYADAIQSRDQEVGSMISHAEVLETILQSLDRVAKQYAAASSSSSSSSLAAISSRSCLEACLAVCQTEVAALDEVLGQLVKYYEPISPDASLVARALVRAKKGFALFKYPLCRPEVIRVRDQLGRAIESLQLATEPLNLGTSLETYRLVEAVQDKTSRIETEIACLRTDVVTPLSRFESALTTLETRGSATTAQIEGLYSESQQSTRDTNEKLDELLHYFRAAASKSGNSASTFFSEDPVLLMQLASRPAFLGSLCKQQDQMGITMSSSLSATSRDLGPFQRPDGDQRSPFLPACTCRGIRTRKRQELWFGPFNLWDVSSVRGHHSGCPLAIFAAPQTQRTRGVKLASLFSGRLLTRAIELSFSMTTGAGGSSISPSFTIYNTVDADISPAFQLLINLRENEDVRSLRKETGESNEDVFERLKVSTRKIIKELNNLFRERKATPFDVDKTNQSLLHLVADAIEHTASFPQLSIIMELARFLMDNGAPLAQCAVDGRQPIHYLRDRQILNAAIQEFLPGEEEMSTFSNPPVDSYSSFWDPRLYFEKPYDWFELYNKWPVVADAHFEPLSAAILRNDVRSVAGILRTDRSALNEKTSHGITPYHLAVAHPGCLKVLVHHSDPSSMSQVDTKTRSVLHWALLLSTGPCESDTVDDCDRAESVRILLDAGISIVPERDFWGPQRTSHGPGWVNRFSDACNHVKNLVASGLRRRRQDLKALAIEHLSEFELHDLDIGPDILDMQAHDTYRALQRQNVSVPECLSVWLPEGYKDKRLRSSSIYYFLQSSYDGELFASLGFPIVDTTRDHEPCVWQSHNRFQFFYTSSLEYLGWLSRHGMQICRWSGISGSSWVSKAPNAFVLVTFIAHALYDEYTWDLVSDADDHPDRPPRPGYLAAIDLHPAILSEDRDSCCCPCSIGGCTPYSVLIRCMLDYAWPAEKFATEELLTYFAQFESQLEPRHYESAARLAIFHVLDIRHTCIEDTDMHTQWNPGFEGFSAGFVPDSPVFKGFFPDCEAESAVEHQEDLERIEKIEMLEILMAEFQDIISDIFSGSSDTKRQDFGDFWSGYFTERVLEGRDEIENSRSWKQEKRAAEEIGVVWASSSEHSYAESDTDV